MWVSDLLHRCWPSHPSSLYRLSHLCCWKWTSFKFWLPKHCCIYDVAQSVFLMLLSWQQGNKNALLLFLCHIYCHNFFSFTDKHQPESCEVNTWTLIRNMNIVFMYPAVFHFPSGKFCDCKVLRVNNWTTWTVAWCQHDNTSSHSSGLTAVYAGFWTATTQSSVPIPPTFKLKSRWFDTVKEIKVGITDGA